MKKIAVVRTDFPSKFGLPRQSGLVPELEGRIVFEPEYRNVDSLRGIEEFSHIWIIWEFSHFRNDESWSPTVRPPKLGGNRRLGVFATRSPNRPNPIGLSCVRLKGIENSTDGPVLVVSGIDMTDGTPVYDIKPYIPFSDCIPGASEGYTSETKNTRMDVVFSDDLLSMIPEDKRKTLIDCLALDPRPGYRNSDDEREYGMTFDCFDISFVVRNDKIYITSVTKIKE